MDWALHALERIKAMKIEHPNWVRARSDLESAIFATNPGEIISVVGPSRVGKSKLLKEIMQRTVSIKEELDEQHSVIIKCKNCSTNGIFSTKAFTIQALQALRHPIAGLNHFGPLDSRYYDSLRTTPETILNPMMDASVRARKTRFFCLDEAHHILHIKGGIKNAAAFLDSMKCFVEDTGLILIQTGAYPLLDIFKRSPHMIGRDYLIHFPRYYKSKSDLIIFNDILATYSEVLRFVYKSGSLTKWNTILYEGSFGCIGLLERWLRNAVGKALSEQSPALKLQHIISTQLTIDKSDTIGREIQDGEKLLACALTGDGLSDTEPDPSVPPPVRKRPKAFQKKPRRMKPGNRS